MLGTGSQVSVSDDMIMNWTTSFLDQPAGGSPAGTPYESNIQIDTSSQLPVNFDASQIKTVSPSRDTKGRSYLAGYLPYNVMNLDFWQVPFRYGERPHLVAKSEFEKYNDASKLGPPAWSNAVPDAFSTLGGTTNNRQYGLLAAAWVQTNPQKTFPISMPGGYVRILIHNNKLVWNLYGALYTGYWTETDSYDFYAGQDTTPDFVSLPVIACASFQPEGIVGNEYLIPPTVFTAIYALPPIPPMSCDSFNYMLQRANEIHPGTTSSQLIGILNTAVLNPTGGDQEFVLYNTNPNDCTSPLICTMLSTAPPYVQGDPDGSEQSLESEYPAGPFLPSFCWATESCDTTPFVPGDSETSATRSWTPGTGYSSTPGVNGCLGKLEVQRETDFNYIVPPCACDL